ncbi:hypothetical protein V493_00400 [Pseudogymnoascus sp. VKM F-4281 (FW-2241)]|nr:hypothetical protein V493_00400 [Pseudogymnoascus sp. VKM F-4281 (FW-2241)]
MPEQGERILKYKRPSVFLTLQYLNSSTPRTENTKIPYTSPYQPPYTTSKSRFSITNMKFTSFVFAALVAAAFAAPAPGSATEAAPAVLEERQSWCTDCQDGKKICCTATQCNPPVSC